MKRSASTPLPASDAASSGAIIVSSHKKHAFYQSYHPKDYHQSSSSSLFHSHSTIDTNPVSRAISLQNTEDYAFLCYLKEIEIRYTILPKSCRIRIERWIVKLCEVDPQHSLMMKDRNLYARLLLEMLLSKSLSYPFTHLPDEGPLPQFPSELKLRMKNFIGAHESIFWRDLYERLIPRQDDPSFPELEGKLAECQEIIGELWQANQTLELKTQELENSLAKEKKITDKLTKKLEKYYEMEVQIENSQQMIEDLSEQVRGLEKVLKQTQQTIALNVAEGKSETSCPSLTWLHNSHAQFIEYQKIYEKFHMKVIQALKFSEISPSSQDPKGHSVIQAKEKITDLLIKQRDDYISELLSHLESYNSNQASVIEKLHRDWDRKYTELHEQHEALLKDYSEVDQRKIIALANCQSLERRKDDLEIDLDQYKKSNENLIRKLSYYQDMESTYDASAQIIVDLKDQLRMLEKTSQYAQQLSKAEVRENQESTPSLTWLRNSHAQFLEYQKIYEKFHMKVIHALSFTEKFSLNAESGSSSGHSIIQAKEKITDLLIKQRDDYISELLSHLESYNSNQASVIEKLNRDWDRKYTELHEQHEALLKDYQNSEKKLADLELNHQLAVSQQKKFKVQIDQLQNKLHLYESYYERLLVYISELEKQRLESSYSIESLVVNTLNTLATPGLIDQSPRPQVSSQSIFESPDFSSVASSQGLIHHPLPPPSLHSTPLRHPPSPPRLPFSQSPIKSNPSHHSRR